MMKKVPDVESELHRLEVFIDGIRKQCASVERQSLRHREEERKAVREVNAINQGVLERFGTRIAKLESALSETAEVAG